MFSRNLSFITAKVQSFIYSDKVFSMVSMASIPFQSQSPSNKLFSFEKKEQSIFAIFLLNLHLNHIVPIKNSCMS